VAKKIRTEAEKGRDAVVRVLNHLTVEPRPFVRRLRLFACGLVRLCRETPGFHLVEPALCLAEEAADCADQDGKGLYRMARSALPARDELEPYGTAGETLWDAAWSALEEWETFAARRTVWLLLDPPDGDGDWFTDRALRLLDCLFPVETGKLASTAVLTIHPRALAWNDAEVVRRAVEVYRNRLWTPDRLLPLEQALWASGASLPDLTTHLRYGEEHCRGCYAIDAVLKAAGKATEGVLG
jgi:hypothetical protein